MKVVVYDEHNRFLGFTDLNTDKWAEPPPAYERDGRLFTFLNKVADTPLYKREPLAVAS